MLRLKFVNLTGLLLYSIFTQTVVEWPVHSVDRASLFHSIYPLVKTFKLSHFTLPTGPQSTLEGEKGKITSTKTSYKVCTYNHLY